LADTVALAVAEASQVGEARRAAAALAGRLGFGEAEAGKVALVVTEAATNLVKHAGGGAVLLSPVEDGPAVGIEVLALDRGPGIPDLGRCLRDGYSTAGTPGTGLGAIVRLSASADFYSRPPAGAALVARLWSRPPPAADAPPPFRVGAVSVPKAGEEVCGDCWAVRHEGGCCVLLVADGLGHGALAAEASRAAARILRDGPRMGPAAVLQAAHAALRGTRGAAVAVAEADLAAGEVRFAGVGNVAGCIITPGGECRSMASHNGTVGHEARKFQEFVYPLPAGALLVMNSDGLTSRWNLDASPGLAVRDPALIAGVLYRDFQRGRDDVTVLVARTE
jgi:anti-sigma regulatory factor (Ser/Thr protein kinase)